jgi:hypothetical protein
MPHSIRGNLVHSLNDPLPPKIKRVPVTHSKTKDALPILDGIDIARLDEKVLM